MQRRKPHRPTFDICVRNLPKSATQRDVEKKFTPYGEIASIYLKNAAGSSLEATIKYLCEPDAIKAVKENHNILWDDNFIYVQRIIERNRGHNRSEWNSTRGGHSLLPFYKPIGIVHSVNSNPPINMNFLPHAPNTETFPQMPSLPVQSSSNTEDIREIVCTYVEDCVTFYGHHPWENTTLDALSTRLQLLCTVLPRLTQLPSLATIYGAMFSQDTLWYRCIVRSNSQASGKILVNYIDYGNCEEIDFTQLVELPDSLANPPSFAPKCVFTALECANSEKLKRKGIMYLQEQILNQKLLISTTSPIGSSIYEVSECKSPHIDIIKDLLQKKFIKRKLPLPLSGSSGSNSPSRIYKLNEDCTESWKKFHLMGSAAKKLGNQGNDAISRQFNKKSSSNIKDKTQNLIVENEELKEMIKNLQLELENSFQKSKKLKDNEETSKVNAFKELESIASHIQFVRSLRCNLPKNDSDISNALSTLLYINSNSNQQKSSLKKKIDDIFTSYQTSLKDIAQCSDRVQLSELIKTKNLCKDELCENLKNYGEFFESSKMSVENEIPGSAIEDMINKLKPKEKSTVDMSLNNVPTSIDELVLEYNTAMVAKKDLSIEVQETTNRAHVEFCSLFSHDFLKLFSLTHDAAGDDSAIANLSGYTPEKFLTSEKFKKSLTLLQNALEAEVNSVYSHCDWKKNKNKDSESKCTLIECLIKELQNIVHTRGEEENFVQKYDSLLENFSDGNAELQPKLNKIVELKQSIKTCKSQLRHALVDVRDFEEDSMVTLEEIAKAKIRVSNLQDHLHEKFIEEDKLLDEFAKLCKTNYPEYDQLYPELGLFTYMKYDGLYKCNWSLENFNSQITIKRGEHSCHHCSFASNAVTIKEIFVDNDKKEKFLDKAMKWHSLSSEYIVPIEAIFQNGYQMYIMCPKRKTLEEQTLPLSKSTHCDILINVLQALKVLHDADIVHGMVEPACILLEDEKASLDFYFKSKSSAGSVSESAFKKRHPTESKSNDILDFGCLVLGVLYPNLKITYIAGIPDIFLHRKIIEKELTSKGFNILCYDIFNKIPSDRSTVDELVNGLFLQYLSKLRYSRHDNIEAIQCPIPPPKQEAKSRIESISIQGPISALKSVEQPVSLPESIQPPVSSPESIQQLVSSPESIQQPISSPESIQQPISSPESIQSEVLSSVSFPSSVVVTAAIKEPVPLEMQSGSANLSENRLFNNANDNSSINYADNEDTILNLQSTFMQQLSLSSSSNVTNTLINSEYACAESYNDFENMSHNSDNESHNSECENQDSENDSQNFEEKSQDLDISELIGRSLSSLDDESTNTFSEFKDSALAKLLSLRQPFCSDTVATTADDEVKE